jgi:translocation and assembly module TamB
LIGLAWKVVRVASKVALVALAVVALVIGVTWSFLQTRRGSEMLRRLALPRVNAALAGKIALERLAFGGDRLTLEDLAIYDPDGRLVGRVERIDVHFSPLALLRRHVDVRALEIRRPELSLVQDARGLNLMRALAPGHPAAVGPGDEAAPAAGGRRTAVDVRALVITDGDVRFRSAAADAKPVHIAEVSLNGKASLADDRLVADAALRMRGGRVDARGTFDLGARRGYATVRASLRGVALDADARIDAEEIAARARIDAADLRATARALTRDFGLPRVAMTGNGRLDVAVAGTLAAPSLRVSARFPALGFGETQARSLNAALWIPNLGVPEALDLDAGASTLSFGKQTLRAPTVAVRAAGRDVVMHAAIAAPQRLRVDVRGKRQPGAERAMTIEALSVRYPEAIWTLRRRARLAFGDAIVLSGFELGADGQRLAADFRLGGATAKGHLVVSGLDLGRLPRALVPPAFGLGGTLDADVRAEDGEAPRVVARAKLAGGRIRGHRDLSFDLAARLDRGRLQGKLRARGLGIGAVTHFDLPGAWPPRDSRAPIVLDVDVDDADLAVVAKAIGEVSHAPAARLKGHARVSVRLDGRVGRPRLRAAVAGRGLAFDDHGIGDLELTVEGEGNGSLAARLTSIAPARTRIDIKTPLSLRSILHHPPSAAALARTPFEVEGKLDRLPLAVLAHAAGTRARVGGTLSANLAITGTASDPEGTIALDVAGATTGRFPPTDARVEVDLDSRAVSARARVVRKGRPLLAAETRVGLSVASLLRPERFAAAPVHVRAVFGPYVLQRVGLPPVSDREPPRELKGKLHADLSVDGTLGAPRVLFHAQASDVSLDKALVGYAQIEASYANRQAKLDTRLTSLGGGTLNAVASMTADLGYPAVTRGFDVRRAPIDVRLDAQRFDLQGLSGATQQLRTVAGLLTASATIRGSFADPRVAGRLEWTDGVVAVTGFGEYKKIHLLLRGDANDLVLEELSAASGSGKARVTGSAKHRDGGGYEVSADAKLDHLPIYTEGQALAVVSLTSRFHGRAAPLDTRLKVDIDDARIELPETDRRDLQPLAVPPDVVLMDGDEPLNRAQAAKLRALLEEAHGHAAVSKVPPSFRLKVNAPRQLWVTGKDTYFELGLSPDFRVYMGERTEVFGQVTVRRGRIDVFGRRFDIKADSTLTFGGPPERPDLDVRAQHTNEAENITVLLTAKGPLDKMAVSVTSPNRPDLSESQLYTLIITGHLQLGGGTTGASPSSQAASLVGGVLASKLRSTLAHRLPLDVLTIDVGAQGVTGTKLEAGRYLTDRLYVGYIGRTGSDPLRYQNRNAVHLEYQITARWEIEAEYGDMGTGTADLIWRKNY